MHSPESCIFMPEILKYLPICLVHIQICFEIRKLSTFNIRVVSKGEYESTAFELLGREIPDRKKA